MGATPISPLIIRTDASAQIGIGHMMRCLALAQAWQEGGGHSIFAIAMEAGTLETKLKSEGMGVFKMSSQAGSIEDAVETTDLTKKMEANWIVVDGYHFDSTYQQKVKEAGYQLMVMDDMAHLDCYYSDIVLNQNINAKSLKYFCESYTKLLLGKKYVLLRREFLNRGGENRKIPDGASKVLVTLGGGDPENATLKVIQALEQMDVAELEAKIIVGPANPNQEMLSQSVQRSTNNLQLSTAVTDMSELMAWANLAVSGGGSTSWELAFMGVPNIMLVLAENQRHIAEELDRMGVVFNLGWHEQVSSSQVAQAMGQLLVSAETRKRMASRGQDLIDGEGIERVLMHMRGEKIRLRKLRKEDCRLIWEWSNDAEIRRVSFSSEPISWEQHVKWFESKLNHPSCIFYIPVDHDDTPIGQVRFDIGDHEATISISVDRRFRGKGYGREIIKTASQKLYQVAGAKPIHSYVRVGNEASIKVFLEAGFKKMGMEMMHGEQAVHLILPKGRV